MGLLITVIGIVLVSAGLRHRMTLEISLLGILSSFVLGLVDVVYVAEGRIQTIYLADARHHQTANALGVSDARRS